MKKYEGTLVFEGKDDFGCVEVIDTSSLRTLHFGTPIIQSSMLFHDPFALEMEYLRKMAFAWVFHPKPQNILCLGLGGSALPKFFWKYCPTCSIDAVDISPLVIEASYRFFHLPEDKRLHVFTEDALRFLELSQKTYDLIFADLYVSNDIAPVVAHPSFFEACRQHLTPQGTLVWNKWSSAPKILQDRVERCFGPHRLSLPNQESANSIWILFKENPPSYSPANLGIAAEQIHRDSGLNCPEILQELRWC